MEQLFTHLPSWVGVLGGTIAGIIAIAFAAINAWSAGFSATEKQKDAAARDLVKILQATVDTLEKEVEKMKENHLENVREISKLRGENETLVKILQGRDEQYLKFQQEGFVAFKRIEDNHSSMLRLVDLLEKNLRPKRGSR